MQSCEKHRQYDPSALRFTTVIEFCSFNQFEKEDDFTVYTLILMAIFTFKAFSHAPAFIAGPVINAWPNACAYVRVSACAEQHAMHSTVTHNRFSKLPLLKAAADVSGHG